MFPPSDCDNVNKCANYFNTVQKPFPNVENGKINTLEFLEAAKGVITLVEKLGNVFAPVKYDMNGNVEKILKRYNLDTARNSTIIDLVMNEQADKSNTATDALLWLTRALHFIELFLEKILDGVTRDSSDSITNELSDAYSLTVKRYHGWWTQQLFNIICKMCPSRTQLFSSLEVSIDNGFEDLRRFIQGLRTNRAEIQDFYATHKLDHDDVV